MQVRSSSIDLKTELTAGNLRMYRFIDGRVELIRGDIMELRSIVVSGFNNVSQQLDDGFGNLSDQVAAGNRMLVDVVVNSTRQVIEVVKLEARSVKAEIIASEGRLMARMDTLQSAVLQSIDSLKPMLEDLQARVGAVEERITSGGWDSNGDGRVQGGELASMVSDMKGYEGNGGTMVDNVLSALRGLPGCNPDSGCSLPGMADGASAAASTLLARLAQAVASSAMSGGSITPEMVSKLSKAKGWDSDGDDEVDTLDVIKTVNGLGERAIIARCHSVMTSAN